MDKSIKNQMKLAAFCALIGACAGAIYSYVFQQKCFFGFSWRQRLGAS